MKKKTPLKLLTISILGLLFYYKDPDASAKRVLQEQGYNNIKMTGHQFLMCGDNDVYARGFTAYTKDSILVKGCVCSGINKGYTIRFE